MAMLPLPASAQEAESAGQVEQSEVEAGEAPHFAEEVTVTVTARKREENLQWVPFSVVAPTEQALRNRGTESIQDISANVAGFSVQNLGPGQSQIRMRGVSAGQIVRDQPGVKEQVGVEFRSVYTDNADTRHRLSAVRQFWAFLLDGTPPRMGGWEADTAAALDRSPHVEAWVKNDHLGFEVLYLYKGIVRTFLPDFLIRLKTGCYLVLEVKGEDSDQNRTKRRFLAEWVRGVNADGRFGRWSSDVLLDPTEIGGILARHAGPVPVSGA